MSNDDSSTVDDQNNAPWPTPYRADTDACLAPEPRLQRRKVLAWALIVTELFLSDDQTFAREYRNIVRVHHTAERYAKDLSPEYLALLRDKANPFALGPDPFAVANEHDFANLHRAVWLLMLHGLARLLNYNLHGDWGDPPGGASSQGRYDDPPPKDPLLGFHTTPNLYGSYAISTQDIPAPDLGIGEAPYYAKPADFKRTGDPPLTKDEIKDIARRLGRALADRTTLDDAGQHPYHRVVKKFYLDRGPHTAEYARAIGIATYPNNPDHPENEKLAVQLAGRISDDDFANIHRGAWLFLAHRFSFLVGKNPFGSFGPVDMPTRSVDLPNAENSPRVFEVPNRDGAFSLNLEDIDPDEDD